MIMQILYFLTAVLVLAIMIFIHELGHYTAGRLLGFRILDFSLGFGPQLIGFKKNGINYAIRAIPLGGACRFYGEEDDVEDDAVAFNSQKPWKRLIVIFAGPFMNFVLAYVLAVVMLFAFGSRDIQRYDNGDYAVVISELSENGPAKKAGVEAGDVILAVNGADLMYAPPSFEDKANVISNEIGLASPDGLTLKVLRDGEVKEIFIPDIFDETQGKNLLGITMGLKEAFTRYGFFRSFGEAGKFLAEIVVLTVTSIAFTSSVAASALLRMARGHPLPARS